MINELGNRYGKLVVVGRGDGPNKKRAYWLCVCDCNAVATVMGKYLRNGDTTSCGCRKRTVLPEARLSHGHAAAGRPSPTYCSWAAMVQRCTNPNNGAWGRYGGRGIQVCERWLKFENFLADMGEAPAGLTIDRIDVNGNYEPGNCRWADRVTQARNTHRAVVFEGKHLKEWERELRVQYHVLYDRLRFHGTVHLVHTDKKHTN